MAAEAQPEVHCKKPAASALPSASGTKDPLSTRHQAVAQHVFQFGNRVNLLAGFFAVVFNPMILDSSFIVIENDKARMRVAVTWLADAANVNHALGVFKFEEMIALVR